MKKLILVLLLALTLGLIACEEPHEHAFGEWVVVKEATELEEGSKERTCECGEKETETIEKLTHTHAYGEWVVVKEATELEEGTKERTCECGEKETETIEKLTHTHEYSEWVVVKEATTEEEGLKERTCECGEKETETIGKLAHTHEYGEWVVVKEATEEEAGLQERTCSCGEKESEEIAKLEHVHNFVEGKCTCGETTEVLVESMELNGKTEMNEGEEQTLTLTVVPEYATNKEVVWSSSDDSIATVENGLVKAIKSGTVTISATSSNDVVIELVINVIASINDALAKEKFDVFMENFPKETNQNLPLGNEEYTISYEFDKCFNESGEIDQEEFDATATGKVKFILGDIVLEENVSVLVYGYFTDVVYEKFCQSLPKVVKEDITFTRNFDDYGGTKIYINDSSNADVLSKTGIYNRPFHDEEVTLRINVRTTTPKVSRYYDCVLNVRGEEMKVKTKAVMKWVEETYPRNMILYYDEVGLPTQCDDYDATIEWFDADGNVLNFNKIAQDPVLGDSQVLTAKISIRGEVRDETIDYFVWNKKYTSDEEKVEDFVNAMNWQNIGVYKYKSAAFYENNWGYLPFIFQGDAVRNQDYMLEYTYGRVRTNIKATSTEYVVIHDTAGGAPTHTAESFALNQVQANNNPDNTYISWHFTAGEDGIYQSLPLDEVAYHAGDGSHVYGDIWYSSTYNKSDCIGGGNRNGIGIESCINQGADYNTTLRMLAKLVAELLMEFNLSTDRIKQHWHFSGKDCPGVIRHCGRWEEFKNLCKAEYFMKTQLKGIEFEYKSLSPDVMNDEGKIIVKDGLARTVSYKVKVNGEGISKEYEFSSTINAYEDWSER